MNVQPAAPPVTCASEQLPRSLNAPLPVAVSVTVPVGTSMPELVSVTVTVHLAAWPTATDSGVQLSEAPVPASPTPSGSEPWLAAWPPSPAYAAVSWWVPGPTCDGV